MRKSRFLLTVLGLILLASSHAQSKNEPYPLEYFALRDIISQVNVSPDGKRLAMMKIATKEGDPVLEIYETNDLSKEPFRVNADPMEIINYSWIGNKDVLLSLRQKVRDKIEGFNQGVYEGKLAKLDLQKQKIKEFREVNARIVNLLPFDPNKVILSFNADSGSNLKAPTQLRPLQYYELDLKSGRKKLLINGKLSMGRIIFDGHGNPRIGLGFDQNSGESVFYYRGLKEDKWHEIQRLSIDSFENFQIVGIDQAEADTLFVIAHNGKDKQGLWTFDARKKQFGELIYARNDVDVTGVLGHSDEWNKPDSKAAVVYATDKYHFEYFDADEAKLYAQLEKSIPYSHQIQIASRSKNNEAIVAFNSGPQDPGTYYLLQDGKLKEIGSRQPSFEHDQLAEVKYIKYKARDGKTIPAYITMPKGDAPFPTIVMPHGGPFVQEVVGYDKWAQLLASRGYLVLQPQYRGSKGYGLEFYKSAFIKGGQGGKAMQDDKDDGVKYLIEEGLSDKDRVAMFGWSYGGYAALIAASRTPQLYQCVVAGAAVTDNMLQVNFYRDRMRGASKIEQENMWVDSLSPIKEVDKVNVPVLLIHGSVDQRVPPRHAEDYLKVIEKAGKPYKYVELDGADHFYSTLFYRHQIKFFEAMIDYLKNDCGPDGL
ncbi:alpha/beta hydrolase family protein [Marinicella gelatinilytica]|uniref:alpha/beta hydrolase family protein n=1 Tax=Marinicella gelatinilytica TaxID=2996017 RepID=UPI002260BA7E|nr:prolyl oligopeptidase family serine peptidase [Marinicella gelatinilytica]MCX7544324.1 prolyl oligopeptidase family serine peptidase [Marinicella gelatinilytica]